MTPLRTAASRAALLALLAAPAAAQWSPPNGQWGKLDPADVRVMTWNVRDGLCSSAAKVEGSNNWCALARVVAALKPDVLLLQECGDNSGNGTGSGDDSASALTTVMQLFVDGGADPFQPGSPAVTSWVRKYAPGYDLPHVFVSNETDGFNRNVILSRFPFADLNGDTHTRLSDIPLVPAVQYAPGGDGGIRGFQLAELDLPDATWSGDLLVANAHLKAGGGSSDETQRRRAAQNVAYVVHHWLNGAGTGVPDPAGVVTDNPPAQTVLGPDTPVVLGGDWNEDEDTNGQKGPAEWLTRAQTTGGTSDGTDRDGSDMTFDAAIDFFGGSDATIGGSKYDYVAWQDSIAGLRLSAVFNSATVPGGGVPPELAGFPTPSAASSVASDHRPVLVDLQLPIVDCNGNGVADTTDIAQGTAQDLDGNLVPDECECYAVSFCQTSPNSVGPGSVMDHLGSLAIADGTFELVATGNPVGTLGIFYLGDAEIADPFGNGIRCIGGNVFRLPIVSTDLLGQAQYAVDFGLPPAASQIAPGAETHFQFWYRNVAGGGAGFNLSDGLRVRFCP